ncbi:MAG TPA: outer membrane protein assembly factor BamC [Methylotenera sp.]|nr:outer membrane protein assembly factor BamC [Methylotenera sp.]HPH05855.1 outer membrane protein assembly factor BamC [Methylotenera sp.]HPN00637.1 outer membrane protein assembly factor BamC [Methylotenera sp.]
MNKFNKIKQTAIYVLLLSGLAACDSIPFIDNSSDYKGAGRARPLEVPPDLTSSPVSDAYSVPGSTSYSTYSQAQEGQQAAAEKVLTTPEGVRMERAGAQRWLVVNAPAEKVWPIIRDFWADQGFAVRKEDAQLGVMETEWIKADAIKSAEQKGGNYLDKFDKWLDGLSGLADRRKFRTRIDHGSEEGTTEIYMTHRTVAGAPDDGKNRVRTQMGEVDTGYRLDADKKNTSKDNEREADELDAELLRRLMVKLGVEEQKSKQVISNMVDTKRAEVVKEKDGSATLYINDPFDRAWRRVGLALDRIGFVIEDKNRSEGVFYVRYADVDIDDTPKKKKGLLETLKFWGDDEDKNVAENGDKKEEKSVMDSLKFWGKDDKKSGNLEKQYRIKVTEGDGDRSAVSVVDKEGARVGTTTANRIVALMYEQLR